MIRVIKLNNVDNNLREKYKPDETALVELDASTLGFDVYLPDVSTVQNTTFKFVKIDDSGNDVNIKPSGSNTIMKEAKQVISGQGDLLILESNKVDTWW